MGGRKWFYELIMTREKGRLNARKSALQGLSSFRCLHAQTEEWTDVRTKQKAPASTGDCRCLRHNASNEAACGVR
jgi:hypothetical protein